MATFEEEVEKLVAPGPKRAAAGFTFKAWDKKGNTYTRSIGKTSIAPDASDLDENTVMRIKSSTKLVTSLSALQCVERGLMTLDGDAADVLPELNDVQMVTGTDEKTGLPVTTPRKNKFTLRKFLTHTSGCTYPFFTPSIMALMLKKDPDGWKNHDNWDAWVNNPVLFEPGEGWLYGVSIDWAGRMVERVSGMDLDDYFAKNILAPLGIKDVAFRLDSRPDMKARLARVPRRTEDGGLEDPIPEPWRDAKVCIGGGGLHASAAAYFEIPKAVLNRDERLLKPETWDLVTKIEVGHGTKPITIADLFKNVNKTAPVPAEEIQYGHGIISAIMLNDVPGWCRKGSLFWGGMHNDAWMVDYSTGLVTYVAVQVDPYEDAQVAEVKGMFSEEMHRRFG